MSSSTPFAGLPDDARALLRAIGPRWGRDIRANSDWVKALYQPLLAVAPRDGVAIERDVAYGTHPRQRLDVFRPTAPRADGAVVVFVHGGAFVRGDKRTTEEIYDNVLLWFARQGLLGLNIEYRLAPEARHPNGAEDVALAMAWAAANVGRVDGNAQRIFLIGHSAGGTHVATYACDPALRHRGGDAAAAVLISARLRADRLPENPNAANVGAYFGDDAGADDAASPVTHAGCCTIPTMIVIAEFENPLLDVYGLEFAHRLAVAQRRAPRLLFMRQHNHMSIMAHFNTDEDRLGREILDFFASVT